MESPGKKFREDVLAALVVRPAASCSFCHTREENKINIRLISAKSMAAGWIAEGRGEISRPDEKAYCPMCGEILKATLRVIPIHCAEFPCPNCGEKDHLKYKVDELALVKDSDEFDFTVSVSCAKCNKKRMLHRALEGLLKVIKIEVGPTGVAVKKADGESD